MTYIQPHYRYGALCFIEEKHEKDKPNTKFKIFERNYNQTWKKAMRTPNKTYRKDLEQILGS